MKKLLIITLASLTLLTLSGCGKKEVKEDNKPVETVENKVETYSFKTNLNNEEINVKFDYTLSNEVYNVSLFVNDNKIADFTFDKNTSIKEMIEGVKFQTIKGTDKDYLILNLIDSTKMGKLLIINKTNKLLDVNITENLEYNTSDDIKKYDIDGNGKITKFYKIEKDKIFYLEYYGTIYEKTPYYHKFNEHEITLDNDKVIDKLIKNGLKVDYNENHDLNLFNIYGGEVIYKEEISGSYKFTTKINNKNSEFRIDYKTSDTEDEYGYPVIVTFSVNNKKIGEITWNSLDEDEIKNVKTNILKGKDKEYLAITYTPDSAWPQEYIYIISENKLIGLVYTETNLWLKLSGNVSDKYKPVNDDRKYYRFEDGKLYYLRLQEKYLDREIEDKVLIDEFVLTLDNDKITNTKTGNVLTGTEPEGGDSNLCEFEEY